MIMEEKTISKLAISSVILSASSIFLWLSWIPGVICGHIALVKIKANPNLKGKNVAIVGLVIGYLFPAALLGLVLYLSGYLEREFAVIDHGRIVWEGRFPHDANDKDEFNRSNTILTPVVINGEIIGTIESRDRNLRLVIKRNVDKKEFTVWKYQDYGIASKITLDEAKRSLIVYYDHTLMREKYYNTVVSLSDFQVKKYLVNRGPWRLW